MGCKHSAPVVSSDAHGHDKDKANDVVAGVGTCCQTESKSGFTYTKGTCALEHWEPIKLLAEGSISTIHLVRKRPNRVDVPYKEKADIMARVDAINNNDDDDDAEDHQGLYALKSILKDHVRNDKYLEEMRSEIETLSRICHPNIINVYEAFERKRHIYLIMDYCRGGDLNERKFSEAQAAVIVRKVLSATAYMHQHKVVHRDLKLENIMFDRKPNLPQADIKVIDLGLATRFLGEEFKHMTDRVGTLYSMSPQVLQGCYDFKCDMWSIGVVAYVLLSGKQPFWGPPREMSWEKRRKVMIDRIMRCEYMRMKGPSWDKISQEAKNCVASLLQISPDRRPTAEQALKMPWIVKYQNYAVQGVPAQDMQYTKRQQLKRAAQVGLAETLLADDIVALKDLLIQEYDKHMEDRVTVQQFHDALLQTKLSPNQVAALFSDKNLDKGAHMDYVNLLNEALDRRNRKQEETIENLLHDQQPDMSCRISKEKLRELLAAKDISDSNLGAILDSDGDHDVPCQQVLEQLRKLNLKKFELICSTRDEYPEEDIGDLVDENNAVIPGGRVHNATEHPKYIYDDSSKSMRPCAEGEDLSLPSPPPRCCKQGNC